MTTTGYTRRSVLAIGGTTLTALGAGCLGGNKSKKNSFKLGGKVASWQGMKPKRIDGNANPTLEMKAETTYEIVWENLDGQKHELIITDKDGKKVTATEHASKKGQTRKLSIKAGPELAGYHCEYHPKSMTGNLSVRK